MTRKGSYGSATLSTLAKLSTLAAVAALTACSPPPAREPDPLIADPPPNAGPAEAGQAASELQRGIAYVKIEKFEEARTHLEISMALGPTAQAAYFLGVSRERLNDRPGAEQAYRKAIELDASLVEAVGNLSALYLDEPARPDLALALLEPAVARTPGDVQLRQNLALAYGLKGNTDAAAKQYDAALAKGDDAQIRFAYGAMLLDAKQPEKAAEQLRKALAGTKDDAPLLVTLGRMLGQAKAFGDCVAAFDRALKIKATDPEWYVRRGTCRHELKDEKGAQADYEAAIKIDPKFATAHYYLGVSLAVVQNKRAPGLAALEKAAKLGGETDVGKRAKAKLAELKKK